MEGGGVTTFSTWAALRTAIKDAIADHLAGQPLVSEFDHGGRRFKFRSIDEMADFLERTYKLEAMESSGDRSTTTLYARARRFAN
jgi:DNA phosphorothioation-dependent restriction protein DptG